MAATALTYESLLKGTVAFMSIDELLDEATKLDNPYHPYDGPREALRTRAGHAGKLTLADTNAVFAYAKRNPTAMGMWSLTCFEDWFAELIALSEGKLFWAEDEAATELSPQDILVLGRTLEDKNRRAKFISLADFLFYENHGTNPSGHLQPFNWLTTDIPASTIKPARRR
jgi:hypothetical protein